MECVDLEEYSYPGYAQSGCAMLFIDIDRRRNEAKDLSITNANFLFDFFLNHACFWVTR